MKRTRLTLLAVSIAAFLAIPAASASAWNAFEPVPCFLPPNDRTVAGITVGQDPVSGADEAECWWGDDWYYYGQPDGPYTGKPSNSATTWTFSTPVNKIHFEIAYNTDAAPGEYEEFTLIAKDSGGNPIGDPLVYRNEDEPNGSIEPGTPVASLELRFGDSQGTASLFKLDLGAITLDVATEGDGRVTSDIGGVDCGQDGGYCNQVFADATPPLDVNLTATPGAGQTLDTVNGPWTGDCSSNPGGSCLLTLLSEDEASTTAWFTGSNWYPLEVEVSGRGRVTSKPAGIACGDGASDCATGRQSGDDFDLTYKAAKGWKFVRWGGACEDKGATCDIGQDEPAQVTAKFKRLPPEVKNAAAKNTRVGRKSVSASFLSTGVGTARIKVQKCSGSDCSGSVAKTGTVLIEKGTLKLDVPTSKLRVGRYRFTVTSETSSSSAYFFVRAPDPVTG
jgi:hypothetical protein